MSKERLEEIKVNAIVEKVHCKYMDGAKSHWTKTYTLIEKDFNWLIEQAEQVEDNDQAITDLNKHVEELEDENVDLKKQNKRYREAIEKAINKCRWNNAETANILLEALEDEKN